MLDRPALGAGVLDRAEPRPPQAPLYRLGTSNGLKTFGVSILRIDNDPLDHGDLECLVAVVGDL